jgi:hypothetical protein
MGKLRIGYNVKQVTELLGSPEYIVDAVEDAPNKPYPDRMRKWSHGFRYDFGGYANFSLLILWDEIGLVSSIHKISPGLWNTTGVFRHPDSVLQADGSFNGIHLYGKNFIGTMTDVVQQDRTKR